MSSQYTLKINEEQAKEMPMVDLAFQVLKAANTPFYYRDLIQEIAKIKGLSEDDVMQVIAQLYTEINIDGRFACVGSNLWGLKRWYPIDKSEGAVASDKRPRIINDDDEEEEELFPEEEDYSDFEEEADEEEYESDDDEDVADDEEDEDAEFEEEIEEDEVPLLDDEEIEDAEDEVDEDDDEK